MATRNLTYLRRMARFRYVTHVRLGRGLWPLTAELKKNNGPIRNQLGINGPRSKTFEGFLNESAGFYQVEL